MMLYAVLLLLLSALVWLLVLVARAFIFDGGIIVSDAHGWQTDMEFLTRGMLGVEKLKPQFFHSSVKVVFLL